MSGPGPPGPPSTPGPIRKWWLGARPRTLPAAVVPVVVATAAAHAHHVVHVVWVVVSNGTAPVAVAVPSSGPRIDSWWCALGALVVALAIQVGTNYANDYSDGIRGTDDARVGPVRLTATGLASPSAVKRAAFVAFGVAALVGLGLAWATSWWILVVGAACLLAGWFYTGGPRPYGYAGLGEVFVFVFFGLVATVGTFYVQTLKLGVWQVWLAAV
ncbi:MAG TPA: 1,4-dihydroxy-2-naphthoate octaprenyltransferase, partial [Acidimicrobiales bacterium]